MRCDRVMQQEIAFVQPEDSAQRAAQMMREENVGFLPVCDETGCVVGTITDRDLAIRVCAEGGDPADFAVGEIMTRALVTCRPEDELTKAEELMARFKKSRILVTDEADRLLGIISVTDIVSRDSNKHAAHTLRKIIEREVRP